MTLASLALTLHVISFSGYMVFPPFVWSATWWVGLSINFLVAVGDDRLSASRTAL